jgi:hypothetical protein
MASTIVMHTVLSWLEYSLRNQMMMDLRVWLLQYAFFPLGKLPTITEYCRIRRHKNRHDTISMLLNARRVRRGMLLLSQKRYGWPLTRALPLLISRKLHVAL